MSKQVKLPAVIETFIKATNDHDGDTYISTFTEDALVNDFARNFWGKAAIKKWSDEETGRVVRQCPIIQGELLITATRGEVFMKRYLGIDLACI